MSTTELTPARRPIWPWILLTLAIVLALAVGLWWWFTRPIQPVVLTPQEQVVVETKLAVLETAAPAESPQATEPAYEPGSREIILTEREINGLLNTNTDLGRTLSFQLGTDAVLARIETDLDPDLPLVGGRKLKARARFLVREADEGPSFVIDDITIWGISLPNDWLGGVKGRNLFAELLGSDATGRLPGVQSFSVQPGKLVIKLAE